MSRFFCPGRTELAGNHTDHQRGRVMAAAVDVGITADAEPNGENVIRVFSEGFPDIRLDLARSLALGLEFKLGGEILRTVIARDLTELLLVGAIIVLRGALSFLIHWEIGHIEEDEATR